MSPDIAAAVERERARTRDGAEGLAPVSVVVPVAEREYDLVQLYREFAAPLALKGRPYEFIFAVEPWAAEQAEALEDLASDGEPVRVLRVGQRVGQSALIDVAVQASDRPIIVTLPSFPRVEAEALESLIELVEGGADMATAMRSTSGASMVNRVQNLAFHGLLRRTAGGKFRDVASGVRAVKRSIFEELPLYGDFFRYLPLMARQQGFEVIEHVVGQHEYDRKARVYPLGVYLRRLIDVLGLLFLLRFTHKPLRFFGLLGSAFSLGGGIILVVLLVQRVGGQGITDRPLLLLGTLMFVLGVQSIALGLIGEIIVHLNASHRRTYRLRDG